MTHCTRFILFGLHIYWQTKKKQLKKPSPHISFGRIWNHVKFGDFLKTSCKLHLNS